MMGGWQRLGKSQLCEDEIAHGLNDAGDEEI